MMYRPFLLIVLLCCGLAVRGQLGLCAQQNANLLFSEDFGSGAGFGGALSAGTTTYHYTDGAPGAGQYTLFNNTYPGMTTLPAPGEEWFWHPVANDYSYELFHSGEPLANHQGKMLLVNADERSGTFYEFSVSGLCSSLQYQFSVWAAALYNPGSGTCPENGGNGTPVNFKLQVWNTDQTQLIAEGITGNLPNDGGNFHQYGLLFTPPPGVVQVVFKIVNNNSEAGCGNDIAFDEIQLNPCGQEAHIESPGISGDTAHFCADDLPTPVTLNLIMANSTGYFFQWMQKDSEATTWTLIPGATGTSFTTLLAVAGKIQYQVWYATTPAQVTNKPCSYASAIFTIDAAEVLEPGSFSGDYVICDDNYPALVVLPDPAVWIDWYDAAQGGNLLLSHSVSFVPTGAGVFWAQATNIETGCSSRNRTRFELEVAAGVDLPEDQPQVILCGEETVTLDAGVSGLYYEWDPGEDLPNTQTVTVNKTGVYVVTATNGSECWDTRSFIVVAYPPPAIEKITNSGATITVQMADALPYEYALDGLIWQTMNSFSGLDSGIYTIYVRDPNSCGLAKQEYVLILPPRFISPNGDSFNDYFTLSGISYLPIKNVLIFDRYGRLIAQVNRNEPAWDGSYQGQRLPADDYWYRLILDDGSETRGHFSLLR